MVVKRRIAEHTLRESAKFKSIRVRSWNPKEHGGRLATALHAIYKEFGSRRIRLHGGEKVSLGAFGRESEIGQFAHDNFLLRVIVIAPPIRWREKFVADSRIRQWAFPSPDVIALKPAHAK